jgi:hypothetical protein
LRQRDLLGYNSEISRADTTAPWCSNLLPDSDAAMTIEPLESRIAPASVSLTYPDLDGDLVRITASNQIATAPPLDLTDLSFVGAELAGNSLRSA